jgi:UDP-N-acetylmuramyl tripeptide synthase
VSVALPYADSRRLTGANLFFATTGAVLETAGVAVDESLLEGWRRRALRAAASLQWPAPRAVARTHLGGASLALAAPPDQLYTATEVNEWALCATLAERGPARAADLAAAMLATLLEDATDPTQVLPPVLEEGPALARLGLLAEREARPALRALLAAAMQHDVPAVLDDDDLTLGLGARGREFRLAALPAAEAVDWTPLGSVPTALVTGSNGKTTTVRLIAAFTRARGWHTGYTCTDGVWIGDELVATGDYSGPAGARRVARDRRVEAAVLETARGGILRRGIAVPSADAAVVTNISSDHFGEYGIDDLDALADAKLSVAGVLSPRGLLVLNADDPLLRAKAALLQARFGRAPPIGWFASAADLPWLREQRAAGGVTCGVRDGRLWLEQARESHDLGAVAAMPITAGGSARYNVANLAAAVLAARALGVAPATLRDVSAVFGAKPADNLGRLMRFRRDGVDLLIDYAHNPAALRGVLGVARSLLAPGGRLGMLLGHAGNRRDVDVAAVARVAAEFRPDHVVVKETESHLRGRPPGEIPRILRAALLDAGLPQRAVVLRDSELAAAEEALAWARPGDVLVLPLHSAAVRAAVLARLGE